MIDAVRSDLSGNPDVVRQDDLTEIDQPLDVTALATALVTIAERLEAAAPLELLAQVRDVRVLLSTVETSAAARAVAGGSSWAEVGHAAGMKKQSAHQRWANPTPKGQVADEPPRAAPAAAPAHAGVRREEVSLRVSALPLLPALRLTVERRNGGHSRGEP